jgi:hypothetical protein
MGLLKSIALDIENLIHSGYSDKEISLATSVEQNNIQYIINFLRNEIEKESKTKISKINNRDR